MPCSIDVPFRRTPKLGDQVLYVPVEQDAKSSLVTVERINDNGTLDLGSAFWSILYGVPEQQTPDDRGHWRWPLRTVRLGDIVLFNRYGQLTPAIVGTIYEDSSNLDIVFLGMNGMDPIWSKSTLVQYHPKLYGPLDSFWTFNDAE